LSGLRRYARFFAGRLGIAGACGLALLVFTAGFLLYGVQPLEQEVRTLTARAERLAKPAASGATAVAQDPAAAIEAMLNDLPRLDEAPAYLARLHERAAEHRLVLEAGEYHVVHDADSRLTRYQVRFPLKGGYVQIRRFVAAVMAAIPTMTLDELSIRRASIGAREVEARVQFALLFAESR
jgi:Tfp pilus assembly protein PilO